MQKFWSFLRGRIILIIMKHEAICRALLNFSWKVLEAPSLWVTKILSYRKNYILPFGKKKKGIYEVLLIHYLQVPSMSWEYMSFCYFLMYSASLDSEKNLCYEECMQDCCKNLFYGRVFNSIPEVCDWYFCCVCVLLISFSNQVADNLKTPFITRIVLGSWANSVKG